MNPLTLNIVYQGQPIRMVGTPDRPEWVAADVCQALGLLGHPSKHMRQFKPTEKGAERIDTLGGQQFVTTVTEPGLYRLLFRSDKPEAEKFREWVIHDVLPTIRRYGRYPANRPPAPQLMLSEVGLFGQPITVDLVKSPLPPLAVDILPRTELIPLKAVPMIDWLPVSVKSSTVYRWHQYGLRGEHLATARVAGKLFTTESAVLNFCVRCARPNPAA